MKDTPKPQINKTEIIRFRVTKKEKNKILGLSKLYGAESLSDWCRHCVTNYEAKFLKK